MPKCVIVTIIGLLSKTERSTAPQLGWGVMVRFVPLREIMMTKGNGLAVTITIESSYGVKTIRVVPMKREKDYVLNCVYSSYDNDQERAVSDLQLMSYFGDDGCAYGLEPCYSNVFSIDGQRAVLMTRTLTKVEKAIAATESREAGDVFMAFCRAIGATALAVKLSDRSNLRECEWRFDTIAAGRNELRRMLELEMTKAQGAQDAAA